MARVLFRETRARYFLSRQSRQRLSRGIPSEARPDHSLCAAGLGSQPLVYSRLQRRVLRHSQPQEELGTGTLRYVFLSARFDPAVEPALRQAGFSPISMRHTGKPPRSVRGTPRAQCALRHGLFPRGIETIRISAIARHAFLSPPGT